MSGRILALDLGSSMGFAYRGATGCIHSGTAEFHVGGRHGYGVRFLEMRRWLTEQHRGAGVDRVYYERIMHHVSGDSAHSYGAFVGTLAAWCEAAEIPYAGVNWATVKKFATGNGAAKKPQMINAMRSRGFDPCDDNEADALALLAYVCRDPALDAAIFVPAKRAKKTAPGNPAADMLAPLDDKPF